MKVNVKRLFTCLAVGALVLMIAGPGATPAGADDSAFSWGGVYVGAHFGYGWGNADTSVTPLPNAVLFSDMLPQTRRPDPAGVLGGVQVGYNWHKGIFVIGAETDFSGSGMTGSEMVSPITTNNGTPYPGTGYIEVHQDTDWLGTLRLRLGVTPVSRLLIYGTGGMAYGHVHYSANSNFMPFGTIQYPASFTKTKVGWTAGGGVEIALGKRWSIKTEYLYYDLGSESVVANPVPPNPPFHVEYTWETAAHTVNIGINFRF